jgi:anti-sigma B factor antagonist
MTDSKLEIDDRLSEDVAVLTLSGQMLLDDGDLAFRRQIHELIGRGVAKIVVDLAGVTYIDSAGVGMMAAKLMSVRKAGGDMKLVNLTTRTHRLLSMIKLLSTFEVFEDEPSAIRSFSWGARTP